MANLLMADLHPVEDPKIWSGNPISTTVLPRNPVHLDEDGCPLEIQPYLLATLLLRKLTTLWEQGIHNWAQIMCRGPDGRPYFLEERELQWANSSLQFLLP